jgi:hypothetical protein
MMHYGYLSQYIIILFVGIIKINKINVSKLIIACVLYEIMQFIQYLW